MRNTKEVPSVTQMVTWKLSDALRGSADRTPDAMLSLAYCMLIDKAFGDRPTDPYRAISLCAEEPVVSDFLHESLRRARLEPGGYAYCEAESRVTAEELSEFLLAEGTEALWLDAEHTTPPDVADLAVMLLGPSSGSRVCDFGCGTGAFMAKAMAAAPEVIVSGIEISANAAAKAKIRLSVPRLLTLAEEEASELPEELRRREVEACLDVGVRVGDMLALFEPAMCDLAFSSYPFGMRTSMLEPRSPFAQSAKAGGLGYRRPLSMDWVFNHMLVEATTDDGKAVAIMSAGACFNTSDAAARRFFVERGLVECVIALPPRLFPGTNAGLMAIVLSKGNTAVRMIDAECPDKICVKTGAVSRSGQSIVCAPHKIVVTVTGGKATSDYDVKTN